MKIVGSVGAFGNSKSDTLKPNITTVEIILKISFEF